MTVYRPPFVKQGDGSQCQWTNCGCACHAMAAMRARRGVDPRNTHGWPPTPTEIRVAIDGLHRCGGTSLNENEAAVLHLYAVDMVLRYNIPFNSFASLIISGRGAVVPIQYSVIAPTKFDASPGFTGGHGVFVNERNPAGYYLVYDPLADGRRVGIPKGPQWWPGALLRRAAEAYPGTLPGHIHASFTPTTGA